MAEKTSSAQLEAEPKCVAIMGGTKQGKTSLINAIMGLPQDVETEGATDSTSEVKPFYLPNKKVTFYEFPGYDNSDHGIENVKSQLQNTFDGYDLWFVVVKDNIRSNDKQMVEFIKSKDMRPKVVRTHIDENIQRTKNLKQPEDVAKQSVREELMNSFGTDGLEIYLVDCLERESHDFPNICNIIDQLSPGCMHKRVSEKISTPESFDEKSAMTGSESVSDDSFPSLPENEEQIHIAVVGQKGHGKSSLVNLLMGFKADEEGKFPDGAAEIDSNVASIKEFKLPGSGNVILYDFPGIEGSHNGIDNVPELLLGKVQKIDLCVIVLKDVISTDVKTLIDFAQEFGIKFVLVRTHIDETIQKAKKRKRPENEVTESVYNGIKDDLAICFPNNKSEDLFLVSCWDNLAHDFEKLKDSLQKARFDPKKNERATKDPRPKYHKNDERMNVAPEAGKQDEEVIDESRQNWIAIEYAVGWLICMNNENMKSIETELINYIKFNKLTPSDTRKAELDKSLSVGEVEEFVRRRFELEGGRLNELRCMMKTNMAALLHQRHCVSGDFDNVPSMVEDAARFGQLGVVVAFFDPTSPILLALGLAAAVIGGTVYSSCKFYKCLSYLKESRKAVEKIRSDTYERFQLFQNS